MQPRRRKICFIITSKIHYARSRRVLAELNKRSDIELQLVVGASAILDRYGDVEKWMKDDGYVPSARITMSLEGGSEVAMAKTAGLGIIEFASLFENLNPDVVVVRGDRYEVLSAAIAAAYTNKTVAHIEGGDLSGTIDESVRHAITKLAHFHLVTNEKSMQRVIKMGESPKYVFNVGSTDVELLDKNFNNIKKEEFGKIGVGKALDFDKEFIIVMQHSVTTEFGKNGEYIIETIETIMQLGMQTVWFWPNIDAGTDEISGMIRRYRERDNLDKYAHFVKYLPPQKFIALLRKASCLVGNSSSGIKECSYLGIPVVNIGTRQQGRQRAENVVDVDYKRDQIIEAVKRQLKHGKYKPSHIYYQPNSSKRIAEILATEKLYIQKSFVD